MSLFKYSAPSTFYPLAGKLVPWFGTLAFVAAKKLPLSYMPVYWGSQFLGGLIAVALLAAIQKI